MRTRFAPKEQTPRPRETVRLTLVVRRLSRARAFCWGKAHETDSKVPATAPNGQCPRQELNLCTRFRKPLLYPLSYGGALCLFAGLLLITAHQVYRGGDRWFWLIVLSTGLPYPGRAGVPAPYEQARKTRPAGV